jgi:hypothetical protein
MASRVRSALFRAPFRSATPSPAPAPPSLGRGRKCLIRQACSGSPALFSATAAARPRCVEGLRGKAGEGRTMRGGAGHGFSTTVRVRPAFFDRGAHPAEKRPLYRHDAAESRTSNLTSATTVAACRAARNALPALPERLTSIARCGRTGAVGNQVRSYERPLHAPEGARLPSCPSAP